MEKSLLFPPNLLTTTAPVPVAVAALSLEEILLLLPDLLVKASQVLVAAAVFGLAKIIHPFPSDLLLKVASSCCGCSSWLLATTASVPLGVAVLGLKKTLLFPSDLLVNAAPVPVAVAVLGLEKILLLPPDFLVNAAPSCCNCRFELGKDTPAFS